MAVSPDLWSVQATQDTAIGCAQIRDYRFPTPSEVLEEEERPILSLTFGGAAGGDGYGRFLPDNTPYKTLGTVILRPPGIPLHAYGTGGPSRILICEYDKSTFEGLTGLLDWDIRRLRRCVDIRSNRIAQSLRRLTQELEQPGLVSALLVELLLQTLLIDLGRAFQTDPGEDAHSNGGLSGWQLRRIRDCLYEATGEWPSVESLAQACGISRCHLSRSFRHATGSTLTDYAAAIRMQRAKALLGQPHSTVGMVAKQIGFGSISSFSTAFRRETGVSPTGFLRTRGPA